MADLSSYVSREALVKSLQTLTGRSDVQLIDGYKVERATSGVEGFTSLVLRVKLSYKLPGDESNKSHVFFIKRMSAMDYQREIIKNSNVFHKEWLYFSQIVPAMSKVSTGRVQIPFPSCYHAINDSDNAAFYLEDLIHSGFRSVNPSYLQEGFDYPHCCLVMKALGRLHALSLAAEKLLDPTKGGWAETFPDFDREYFYYVPGPGDPPPIIQNMIIETIENLKELCKEIEGLPKEAEASGALGKILEGAWPTICRLKETPSKNRRVMTHGDCWANNMMFRYEKKENNEEYPVGVKFYDLQLAKVCHPSIDLLYFMYLNTLRPFREKYFSALINEYYASLTDNLKLLDGSSPPYSLTDFKTELMGDYKPFGVAVATFFRPLMLLGEEFMLTDAEDMTPETIKELYDKGNASAILARFHKDAEYRCKVEDIVREFLEVALPNGLGSVSSSPLLL